LVRGTVLFPALSAMMRVTGKRQAAARWNVDCRSCDQALRARGHDNGW
jgi:hypothetical protein